MLATKAINTLVGILTLCQLAVAFFPWTPDYICARDPSCHPSKPSVPAVDGRTTTIKLKQRLPEVRFILSKSTFNNADKSSLRNRMLPKSVTFMIDWFASTAAQLPPKLSKEGTMLFLLSQLPRRLRLTALALTRTELTTRTSLLCLSDLITLLSKCFWTLALEIPG